MTIDLDNISSGYNLSKINGNFEKIENKVNDEVLLRDGGGNTMKQDIDMDSNRVYNLPDASTPTEPITRGQLEDLVDDIGLLPLISADNVSLDIDGTVTDVATYANNDDVADYAALQAINTAKVPDYRAVNVYERTAGTGVGGGVFRYVLGDFSATVTSDPLGGIFVSALGDAGRTVGCWVRVVEREISCFWFGAIGNGVNDDTVAIQSGINYVWHLSAGTLTLGDERHTFKTTDTLYFRVVQPFGDRGIDIRSNGCTIACDHTGIGLEVQGGFKCRLQGFYIITGSLAGFTNDLATGLVIAGANNSTITDNAGNVGSGNRSEHFILEQVRTRGADIAARFGVGNDQLDYTSSTGCYFRGTQGGVIVEEGNTYCTFTECAAHGSTTAEIAWDIRGQAKMVGCYAFSSTWAVSIVGNLPIVIIGMEGELLDNAVRWNGESTTDYLNNGSLNIQSSHFYLYDANNIGLLLGSFVSATVEGCYFGGTLNVLDDVSLLQGGIYKESNTYFTNRDSLVASSVDYELKGAKDSLAERAYHESTLLSKSMDQNLINNSAAPTAASATVVTLNSKRFQGVKNAAHSAVFSAAVSSYIVFRGGTEILTAGWESEIQGQMLTFGVWAKLDDSEAAAENTNVRLWCFTGAYPGTDTLGRKNMKLTKEWKYFILTCELPNPIITDISFAIRNSVAAGVSVNFRAPMLTLKGLHNNYYETTGTAKIY